MRRLYVSGIVHHGRRSVARYGAAESEIGGVMGLVVYICLFNNSNCEFIQSASSQSCLISYDATSYDDKINDSQDEWTIPLATPTPIGQDRRRDRTVDLHHLLRVDQLAVYDT
jgi:hypothetical protein